MKVTVESALLDEHEGLTNGWRVRVTQGVQSFTLGYESYDREEILWLARMFRRALQAHNVELLKNQIN